MLDYTDHPAALFGFGLSANVVGIFCGNLLGMALTSLARPGPEVAVLALLVICITLVILPPLNQLLVLLLQSHACLAAYSVMSEKQTADILRQAKTLDPLTGREKEVLQIILSGKPNKEIAAELSISENTVKTHAGNIYSKYNVGSRAELISSLLKNRDGF